MVLKFKQVFNSYQNTHTYDIYESFSCTPFISERRLFNNAMTSIADVRTFMMTLLWR